MNQETDKYAEDDRVLLQNFNNREVFAYSCIYQRYYNEFHLYAATLYVETTVEPRDAVQDVFLYMWQNTNIRFEKFINIKAFVIIMLKNRYKNHLEHLDCERRFRERIKNVDDTFELDMLENRIYTQAEQMLRMLPKDYAEILKLYLEGWRPEEISTKLNTPIQSIYNKKSEAINLLRRKFSREDILLFLMLMGH